MIDRFDRATGRVVAGLGYVVALSIAFIALSIPLDLLMRRAGLGNIPWLYEVIEYVLYAGVFLAAPWVLREGAHVRVDLLTSGLPARAAAALEQLLDVLGAVVAGALSYYGWRATVETYVGESRQFKTLIVHDWWLMAIFCVAALLMTVEFLLRVRRARETLRAGEEAAARSGF